MNAGSLWTAYCVICDAEVDGTSDNIGELSINNTKKIAIRPPLVWFRAFFDGGIMTSRNFASLLCLRPLCIQQLRRSWRKIQRNQLASSQLGLGAY